MTTTVDQTTAQPLDLDAIAARLAAATPGPWTTGADEEWSDALAPWALVIDPTRYPLVEMEPGARGAADAEFIAHARADVEQLLAEVRRLTERLGAAGLLAEAVAVWACAVEDGPIPTAMLGQPSRALYDAAERHRLMVLALDSAEARE